MSISPLLGRRLAEGGVVYVESLGQSQGCHGGGREPDLEVTQQVDPEECGDTLGGGSQGGAGGKCINMRTFLVIFSLNSH